MEKNLYLCLVVMLESPTAEPPFKFMCAPIASSESEAKEIAIAEARAERPDLSHLMIEINAYSFKRTALERAATEILGWTPPSQK